MNHEYLVICYKLSSTMITTINNQLGDYHLTFQQLLILLYLEEQNREVASKDICQYFGISHSTTVGLIARMTKASFIVTEVSHTDRRERILHLTHQGREVIEQSRHVVDDYIDHLFQHLSDEEQKQFINLLFRLDSIFRKEKEGHYGDIKVCNKNVKKRI